ncbi:MAG TPA: MFS transporter [Candidatus Binatia bacterium]|jgi:sugar phosphate permease|nr:MFS transporter [Candidatus Binatia bacterium]
MALWVWFQRMSHQADRYRWYALGLTTLGQAAANILSASFGPIAPLLQADFRISRAEIGLISAAMSLTAAPSALFGGRAADRVGERRVLVLSGLVTAFAALAIARSDGFWGLVASCLVLGLGNGIQNPAGSAAIMRWFPPRQRGVAMGIRQTGVPLGGILAASVAPALAFAYGWRTAYVLGGLVAFVGTALIFVAYYDPPRTAHTGLVALRSFRDIAYDKQIWWLGFIFNCQLFTQSSVTTYFVLFLHEALDTPVIGAAALLAVVNGVAMIARIGWGLFSDRHFQGRRRPVLLIIVLLTVCSTLGAAALPRQTPWFLAVGLAVLLGSSAFAWTGVLGTLVIETAGRESAGSAISLVQVLATPAALLGPPFFGFLTDQTGTYRAAWLALALAGTLGLVAVYRVTEDLPNY